jgi:hypothetical protein
MTPAGSKVVLVGLGVAGLIGTVGTTGPAPIPETKLPPAGADSRAGDEVTDDTGIVTDRVCSLLPSPFPCVALGLPKPKGIPDETISFPVRVGESGGCECRGGLGARGGVAVKLAEKKALDRELDALGVEMGFEDGVEPGAIGLADELSDLARFRLEDAKADSSASLSDGRQ